MPLSNELTPKFIQWDLNTNRTNNLKTGNILKTNFFKFRFQMVTSRGVAILMLLFAAAAADW